MFIVLPAGEVFLTDGAGWSSLHLRVLGDTKPSTHDIEVVRGKLTQLILQLQGFTRMLIRLRHCSKVGGEGRSRWF